MLHDRFSPAVLLAQEVPAAWHADSFGMALLATAAFGLLGVTVLVVGFKMFDLLTPKLDLEKELSEKNLAVAIVIAALLMGLSWIVVRSLG